MMHFWSAKENALAAGLVLLAASAPSFGAVVTLSPTMDIYMYENASDRGARGDLGTFGGPVGASNGNDDRFGQGIFGWNTVAGGIQAGLGVNNYVITKVTLRMNQIDDFGLIYDPTYDSYRTYLPQISGQNDPDFLPDTDAGRPMELYGLGLRNGYTELAVSGSISGTRYGEGSPFGSSGEHTRNAYAWSPASPRPDHDVSENVTDRFESAPFAVGNIPGLNAGDFVAGDTTVVFEVNLANAGVSDYFRDALNNGQLGLALSSLHPTSFNGSTGGGVFPRFSTSESPVPFLIPQLEIEYTVIPEPSAGHIFILGAAALASLRAWRRRDQYS